ncbi:DUF5655 domain-containing protein [Microlunatus sp. Y2014]|uniref:DUF5655 domain-containing protein n=1 Tax=Microlunatus sp. Y2014 TaxID=3418488 RepID=UPI003DA74325
MAETWNEMMAWCGELLQRRTGEDVATWNTRVAELDPADEPTLRAWLADHDVTGYPQMILVYERFGYPEFLTASAEELLDGQYRDRPQLRPIADRVLELAVTAGPEVTVQMRKTYVSLVGPRRTFAWLHPRTKSRVDLGLRLEDESPHGRLLDGKGVGNGDCTVRIGLTTVDEVDDEVAALLQRTYDANIDPR